jgi:hypothetical protein
MKNHPGSPMENAYSIPEVSAEAIMMSVEGICLSGEKGLTLEEVSRYINKTNEYARRCINLAIQLGMVRRVNDKYVAEAESEEISKVKKEDWPILFRKFLQRYKPFILFAALINRGDSIEEACRKVKTILNISSNSKIIRKSLVTWGKYANILEMEENGTIKLRDLPEGKTAFHIKELIDSLSNELKVRIYVENKLTDVVFSYLQHDEVEFIVKAFKEYQSDPRSAIEDMGKAFEDFLRRVGADRKVDLSRANGIGECAQMLRKTNLITQKHLVMCEHINAFRLAAAHSKEKLTLRSWKISQDAAFEVLLTTLTLMRSIFLYVFKKEQVI